MSGSHALTIRLIAGPAIAAVLALAGCASSAPATSPTVAPAAPAPTSAATMATPAPPSPTASPATATSSTQSESEEYTVLVRDDPKLGKILTDAKGRTLYRYTRDSTDKSVCAGGCAQVWPPLTASGTPTLADGVPGKLGVITRDDGVKQVTYNGTPLYYYAKDSKPGETTGQGVGGVWYVVMPGAGSAASTGGSGTYQKTGY